MNVQPTYPGPIYPNVLQGGNNPYCPLPGSGQGFGQAALQGLPDGDTMRQTNPVFQVALAQPQQQGNITWELAAAQQQQAAMAQQAALAQQPPADVATNPLWERAALAQQAAVMAQQAAATQQAAMPQQVPANVANNPLWERAAAGVTPQPQQQGNITWELAAAQQQQAAMAQQAALAQQPPADVATNPLWERAALAQQAAVMAQQAAATQQAALAQQAAAAQPLQGQYAPIGGAQGYFPPSQYPASQYPQANNGMAPIAAQVPVATAPPIMSNAQMPHAYRGNCTECHQIIDAGTSAQNTQAAANQLMWNNNVR
jgi:hypothetical protein